MTGAIVNSVSSTYLHDGLDNGVSKTVVSNTTDFVLDLESGLPVVVDDGTDAYLHADGLIAEVDSSNRCDDSDNLIDSGFVEAGEGWLYSRPLAPATSP